MTADLATLQTRLDALKAARASGVRRINIAGVIEREYRSDAEMVRAIAALEAEITAAQGAPPVRNVVVRSKGWS